MDKRNFFLFFVFFLVFASFVSSAPPFQTNINSFDGLMIETPTFDIVPINSNYTFHYHVYNVSSGINLNTSSCVMHLYDFKTGDHILQEVAVPDENGIDFDVVVNDSLFSDAGSYYRLFQCNDSNIGGYVGIQFDVGSAFKEATIPDAIIQSLLILVFVVFFIVSLVFAFVMDGENQFTMGPQGERILELNSGKYIKLFLYLLSYFFFWMLTWSIWITFEKFVLSQTFTSVLNVLFIIETILLGPIIIMVIVIGLVKHFADSELLNLSKRGLNMR